MAIKYPTARFECGCWFHEVGCVRHPPITGEMCCPIHLKPYPPGRKDIEKIEGYDTYKGVVGDLVDKVNELVDVINELRNDDASH